MLEKINHDENNIVHVIVRKFYSGSCLNLEQKLIQEMTCCEQEQFLNATTNSKLLKKYPVNKNFTRLFLKKMLQYLEINQEVHDDFYTSLCMAMKSDNAETFSYRHYIIGNDLNNIVTIQETNNMVVNGTTGMRTWEAAKMFSDWALCNVDVFKNRRVLELGSGVGLTGITMAKFCETKYMLLSDCHHDVLNAIKINLSINFPDWHQQETSKYLLLKGSDQEIGVAALDWNDANEFAIEICPDVVIGSDIVYDPTILKPLYNVIQNLININSKLEVYIAGVIRNEETFNMFLNLLDSSNLQYYKIIQSEYVYLQWDLSVSRYLLKIIKRK